MALPALLPLLARAAAAARPALQAVSSGRAAGAAAQRGATANTAKAASAQTDFADKDLFKRAFGAGGKQATPQQIQGGQNATETLARETEAREQVTSNLKELGKAATASVTGLAALPKVAMMLAKAQLESQQNLRMFNAEIAGAFAKLEGARFGRQSQTAGATSGSTSRLAESIDRMESTLLPATVTVTNFMNGFSRGMSEAVQYLYQVNTVVNPLLWWLDKEGKESLKDMPPMAPWQQGLNKMADDKFMRTRFEHKK